MVIEMSKKWYDFNLPENIFLIFKDREIVGYCASKIDARQHASNICGKVIKVKYLSSRNVIECPKCGHKMKTRRKLMDLVSCWKCKYTWYVLKKCKDCKEMARLVNGKRVCKNLHSN